MAKRPPLSKKGRALLDGYVVEYLDREPAPLHSIFCHLELHSTEEIFQSVKRLQKAGRIAEVNHQRKGSCWAALRQSKAESPANGSRSR